MQRQATIREMPGVVVLPHSTLAADVAEIARCKNELKRAARQLRAAATPSAEHDAALRDALRRLSCYVVDATHLEATQVAPVVRALCKFELAGVGVRRLASALVDKWRRDMGAALKRRRAAERRRLGQQQQQQNLGQQQQQQQHRQEQLRRVESAAAQ